MTLSSELINQYETLLIRAIKWFEVKVEEEKPTIKFFLENESFNKLYELKKLVENRESIERKQLVDLITSIIDEYEQFLNEIHNHKLINERKIEEELLEIKVLKDEF